jgi:hypothetical protein
VVEKPVFGILHDTRKLWVQLLCNAAPAAPPAATADLSACDAAAAECSEGGAVYEAEAQAFISNVLQPCINLFHISNPRDLMLEVCNFLFAWLQVPLLVPSPPFPASCPLSCSQSETSPQSNYAPLFVAPLLLPSRQLFPRVKFLPALQRLLQVRHLRAQS